MQLMIGCLCFGVLLILVNIYQLRSLNVGLSVGDPEFGSSSRPTVWMNAKNVREQIISCGTDKTAVTSIDNTGSLFFIQDHFCARTL